MRPATSPFIRLGALALLMLGLAAAPQAQSFRAEAPALAARYVPGYQAPNLSGIQLLYDQVQGTQTGGVVSQNNTTATQFDNAIADDVTVPAGVTWTVTRMFARGFYTTATGGTPGTCESATVSFWSDNGGEPGTQLEARTVVPSDVTGSLTLDFDPVTLAAGATQQTTYWVALVCSGANLNLGVNGRWNWFNNSVVRGTSSLLINPGGGFSLPAGWNVLGTDRDFSLSGSSSGTALFPTLGLAPASLAASVEAGSSVTETLTISNTGDADLSFSFPAYTMVKRLAELASRGVDVNRRAASMDLNLPKGVEPVSTGNPAAYRVGGPDAGGYGFIDSTEPGGPIPGYVDISASGTQLAFEAYGCTGGDPPDEGRAAVELPFPFTFYGVEYTTAYVYANGVIGFDPAFTACTFTNSSTIPNTAGINGFLAPFWDDLNTEVTGAVYVGATLDGRFVIQYKDVPRFGTSEAGRGNNFEVILSPDGSFTYEYGALTAATQTSFTIGIENQTASTGLLVHANAAGYLVEGMSIAFLQLPDVVAGVSPASGTVAPGASQVVDVEIAAVLRSGAPASAGVYNKTITLSSNDPAAGSTSIPVQMTVTLPPFSALPSPLTSTQVSGASGTETLTLSNNTDAEITYAFPQYGATRRALPAQNVVADHAKDAPDNRPGQAVRDGGGPDGFGYQWADSNEPGGPTYNWTDIVATGTAVTLGDDASVEVPLPFTFPFYGADQNSIRIVSNGFLAFGGTSNAFSNAAIPTAATPNAVIAPFWDDFDPTEGGTVHYQTMADGSFVVQYTDIARYIGLGTPSGTITMQAILYPSGAIKYQYQAIPQVTNSATIGIENADGTDGLQVVFNTDYVAANLAILIQARPSFVTGISAPSGTIPANSSVDVDVTFDALGLLGGVYEGSIDVTTSLPSQQAVPVSLTVIGTPEITVNPTNLAFGDVLLGDSTALDLTVSNNGSSPLTISGVASDNADFTTAASTPITVAPGATATISVQFEPSATGVITGNLAITSDAPTSPTSVGMTGTGLEPPDFDASPGSFTFNVQASQVSDAQLLTLSNTGAGAGTYTVTTRPAPMTVAAPNPAPPAAAPDAPREKLLTGAMPATPGSASAASGDAVVADGSFEGGTPNAAWTEASVAFGTPLCDAVSCGLGGGTGPRTGAWWTWFGGATAGDTGSMEQVVTIPAGTATLTFWLEIPTIAAGGTGFVTANMDGTEIFRATYADDQPTYVTYARVDVDVSAYADGGAHTLRFASVTTGSGNFFIDDVSIEVEAGIQLTATPASGTVDAGGNVVIDLVADATNAEVGSYEYLVTISTNEPGAEDIVIPVTINVAPFVSNEGGAALPEQVTLYPSFPNPVRSSATLKYAMPQSGAVSVRVYDVAGRLVSTVVDTEQAAGFHEAQWDAAGVASGVYVVRLQAGNDLRTVRISVVR